MPRKSNKKQYKRVHTVDVYMDDDGEYHLEGSGVFDTVKNLYQKTKSGMKSIYDSVNMENAKSLGNKALELGNKAMDAYTSETGVKVRNALEQAYNPEATQAYPGEKHAILKMPSGKYQTAQFIGPGTQLIKRLALGQKGLTDADRTALVHDIEYTLSQYSGNKEAQKEMGRKADLRMIKNLDKIDKEKRDDPFNTKLARNAIHWKTVGEDLGIMDPHKFLGELKKPDYNTQAKLNEKLAEMTKLGYGKRKRKTYKKKSKSLK